MKKVPAEKPSFLQVEMTKYFGVLALVLLSLERIIGVRYLDWKPIAAPMMFPMMSLKIHSRIVRIILVILTQVYVDTLVFEGFTQTDIILTVILCIILFAVNEAINEIECCQRNKKKLTDQS